MSKIIQAADGTNEFTNMLVVETLKLINGKYSEVKKQKHVSLVFLAHFAGTVLFKALTEKPEIELKTKEEQLKFTMNNFGSMKLSVQESIAAAFSGAMNTYSGMEVEYYCQVRPVGPAVNKEPI